MSGLDSSRRHSATRRFSPPDRLATGLSPGGQRRASIANLDRAFQIPGIGGVDLLLQLGLFADQRHHFVVVGHFAEFHRDFVEAVDDGFSSPMPSIAFSATVLLSSSSGSCRR